MSFTRTTIWRATVGTVAAVALMMNCLEFLAADAQEPPQRKHRLIYNSDGMHIFKHKEPPMTPADVRSFVDEVAGTGVTTFAVCPNPSQNVAYPTRVGDMLGEHLTPAQRKRVEKAKWDTTERAAANVLALVKAGHDPIGLVIERAREKGMEAFLTYRMNTLHVDRYKDSLRRSRFWQNHPQWRIDGGNSRLNFAVPEVRAHRLAQLREVCERYVVDGLDLDFQRWPSYFPKGEGPQHLDTMTGFVRQIRQMTGEVGAKRGRPILLSVRVRDRPARDRDAGLDPGRWAAEGLIDFVTISHFLSEGKLAHERFPLPVAEYRKLLPTQMPLYGSVSVSGAFHKERTNDVYRKVALRLWQDGADGIMLFNFFACRKRRVEPPFELLNELGDPKKIRLGKGSQ